MLSQRLAVIGCNNHQRIFRKSPLIERLQQAPQRVVGIF